MPKASAEREAPSIRTAATSSTMFVTRAGLTSVGSWPWLTLFDVLAALPADWHRYIFPGSFGGSLTCSSRCCHGWSIMCHTIPRLLPLKVTWASEGVSVRGRRADTRDVSYNCYSTPTGVITLWETQSRRRAWSLHSGHISRTWCGVLTRFAV